MGRYPWNRQTQEIIRELNAGRLGQACLKALQEWDAEDSPEFLYPLQLVVEYLERTPRAEMFYPLCEVREELTLAAWCEMGECPRTAMVAVLGLIEELTTDDPDLADAGDGLVLRAAGDAIALALLLTEGLLDSLRERGGDANQAFQDV